jgi:signal transduction histidine kinase
VRNKIILLACTFIVIVSAILTAYYFIQHDQTVKLEQFQNEVVEAMIQQQQEDVINNFRLC